MNKLKLIAIMVISSMLFAACGSNPHNEGVTKEKSTDKEEVSESEAILRDLKRLTNNYSLEQAKADSCLVMENGDVTSGKEVFDEFLGKTSREKDARIRVVNYYTLDESTVSEEYYEQEKDSYPVLFVTDVVYENGEYKTYSYANEDDELVKKTYKYIIKDEFDANPEATFTNATYYMLVNDKSLTFNTIVKVLMSSNSNDYDRDISHFNIYQKHNYK